MSLSRLLALLSPPAEYLPGWCATPAHIRYVAELAYQTEMDREGMVTQPARVDHEAMRRALKARRQQVADAMGRRMLPFRRKAR